MFCVYKQVHSEVPALLSMSVSIRMDVGLQARCGLVEAQTSRSQARTSGCRQPQLVRSKTAPVVQMQQRGMPVRPSQTQDCESVRVCARVCVVCECVRECARVYKSVRECARHHLATKTSKISRVNRVCPPQPAVVPRPKQPWYRDKGR